MVVLSFIDTSVLCNLVPVPGRDQEATAVKAELTQRLKAGERFILPITAVIETGNFIAQLSDGRVRRQVAETFAELLQLVVDDRAPWVLNRVEWNAEFLSHLLAGADTRMTYVEHAVAAVGAGDLCIVTERSQYEQRSQVRAKIWTLDQGLGAYS